MITDQGSNFVRLLKQKVNTFFIDEKDNVEVTQIDEVEKEIEQINDELNEVKSFALSNDIDDDADEFVENGEILLKDQEGGILNYLDYDADEQEKTFSINLGKFYNISYINQTTDFNIYIKGSTDLPRFSCGNHKINLAVRSAIKKHNSMSFQLRKLNIWITSIRKSVELTKVFANAKCRQRLENDTRWGSTFLMLEQIVKADKRGLLDEIKDDYPCPLSLHIIQNYLCILSHAYFFNIGLQRQSATIAEIIPSVLKCISSWDSMKDKISNNGKKLCNLLMTEFKTRFDYELNSHLYLVSQKLII